LLCRFVRDRSSRSKPNLVRLDTDLDDLDLLVTVNNIVDLLLKTIDSEQNVSLDMRLTGYGARNGDPVGDLLRDGIRQSVRDTLVSLEAENDQTLDSAPRIDTDVCMKRLSLGSAYRKWDHSTSDEALRLRNDVAKHRRRVSLADRRAAAERRAQARPIDQVNRT
jgi:hypothetical protein